MSKLELAEQIGIKILDSEYEANMAYLEDDSEYIPRQKRLIKAIVTQLHEEGCSKDSCSKLQERLYLHVKSLYLKMWLIHAEEQEGAGNFDIKAEQKRAYKEFDGHYLG